MKTSSKALFIMLMVISTLMILSSSSWLNMWIGLEVNLMSFIPLMSMSKNLFLSQSTMMYFLIQSMASMLFITFILINKYNFIQMSSQMSKSMIMFTMMMKMGMPPFHMWFPEIMNKMKWEMCLLLMTWQKIGPMFIISTIIEMSKIIITMICVSAITGAIGGLNQTSTRKIMAYSSINHISWMIACAATYKKSWTMYMATYFILMITSLSMLYEYNIMFINQMNIFFKKNMEKMMVILMMLSLGGLPPFLGFMPKWIAIQQMISSKEFAMMLVMMLSTLITLVYYLRMSTSMNLIMSHSQKWLNLSLTNKKTSMYIYMTNLLLPMMILLLNFY